jgi:hypothetical protein
MLTDRAYLLRVADLEHIVKTCPEELSLSPDDENSIGSVLAGALSCGVHWSDVALLENLALLLDRKSVGRVKTESLCLLLVPMLAKDARDCFQTTFRLLDVRRGSGCIDRAELTEVIECLNNAFFFCGDVRFSVMQIDDLVSSLFTSVGKIDGSVYYEDMCGALASHSLVELFMSQRFQGSWRDKVFDASSKDSFFVSIH